jgi:hypothetical protein
LFALGSDNNEKGDLSLVADPLSAKQLITTPHYKKFTLPSFGYLFD